MGCFYFFRKEKKSAENLRILNAVEYSFKEMLIATCNFNISNKIGEGGFGCVYKGKLKNGVAIAVKQLSEESRQGVHEFLTELRVISVIEHENLVKLYGYCVEGNQRILVYEYCENNSLSQTLLGRGRTNDQFSWSVRSQICLSVAEALAFLHERVRPHVVHRDIKASNILLDRNFKAKISDFGLAKLIPDHLTHISTRVAGTAGYLAPEYALYGQLTRKADVYSFGVLLLEIISGRCNRNPASSSHDGDDDRYLLETAWRMSTEGDFIRLIDESLDGDFSVEDAGRYVKVALICTQESPKDRPSMSEVVGMLRNEVSVEKMALTRPGLLCDLMDIKVDKGMNRKRDDGGGGRSPFSSTFQQDSSAVSFDITDASNGVMTFSSVNDRSD